MGRPRKYPLPDGETTTPSYDGEEIHIATPPEPVSQGMTDTESRLLDAVEGLQKEVARLKSIADQNKGRAYDHEQRDKSFKGFLRYVDDPADPVVEWKTVKNISYVHPQTGMLVQEQKMQVKTLSGRVYEEMDISDWNMLRSHQTKIKFLRLDHLNNKADIQISLDDGQTFLGPELKDFPLTFVNP